MDAQKGTFFVKFEHDPWAFRADRTKFTEANDENAVQPLWSNSKYNSWETYFDTKFKNSDSLKLKYSSKKIMEANFALKNLTLPAQCGDCRIFFFFKNFKTLAVSNRIRNFLDSKEMEFNLHKEIRTNYLKKMQFELKGKDSNENLSMTIENKNSNDNLQRNYEMVYKYPFSDNFKVKVNFLFNFNFNYFIYFRLLSLMTL